VWHQQIQDPPVPGAPRHRTRLPRPGDHHPWKTGICWFWCDWSVEQQVLEVGEVTGAGDGTPVALTACGRCLGFLQERVESYQAYTVARAAVMHESPHRVVR
jgi:hypothetical protein